jgi:hypothetical protein
MVSLTARILCSNSSQELEYIGLQYPNDEPVDGDVRLEPITGPDLVPASQAENITESQEGTNEVEDLNVKPRPKRKNTVSFSKKMLLATMDLFVYPLFIDKFSDSTARMVGQVKECPR